MPVFLSLSSWRAWIEIMNEETFYKYATSLSSWRAWIEMKIVDTGLRKFRVALLMESVD